MKKNLLYFLLGIFITACTGDSTMEVKEKQITVETDMEKQTGIIENPVVYAIPSPNEQLEIMRATNNAFSPILMHSLDLVSSYTSNYKKALNFGVYSTDAAYLTCFGNTNNFINYLNSLEELGSDLGIASIYNEELVTKATTFKDEPDSLFDLSSENYLRIFDKMIQNENGTELGLILAGGWIETMYILFESSGGFNENNELQDIILTQNLVLENLIGFLSEQGVNEENNQILKSLAKFETIFQQVNCSGSETTVIESDNALVFEGGSNCAFSEELYHKLKQEIFLAREQITQLN